MPFDLTTAKPVGAPEGAAKGFDLSTAKPVEAHDLTAAETVPFHAAKGVEMSLNSLLNTPTNAANLGIMLANMLKSYPRRGGTPDVEGLMEPMPLPDLGTRYAEAFGGQSPMNTPVKESTAQEIVGRGAEFAATAGRAALPAAASGALSMTAEKATGSPAAGTVAALALPMAQGAAGRKVAQNTRQQQFNERRDEIARQSRELGLVIPPVATNPTATNRLLDWAGGSREVAQVHANRNAPRIKELAAQDVGVPARDLTPVRLAQERARHSKAYDDVRAQAQPFPRDAAFDTAVRDVEYLSNTLRASFPRSSQFRSIDRLVADLRGRRAFVPEALVEKVRQLRADASALYKKQTLDPGDAELAKANQGAADALEELAERTLTARGMPELAGRLRDARRNIAKLFTVEEALDVTNRVDASKLVRARQRGARLDGNLERIADFAEAFDGAAALNPTTSDSLPLIGRLAAYGMLGGGTFAASGNPVAAAATTAALAGTPLAIRPGLTTAPGQWTGVPNYQSRVVDALANQSPAPLALLPEYLRR